VLNLEQSFPEFFKKADQYSQRWQSVYLWTQRVQLLALLVAAALPALVDVHASVVVVAFSIALVAQVARTVLRADERWWNGRAGAESAKTLAWKYSVGGLPFDVENSDAELELSKRIATIAEGVSKFVPVAAPSRHVTDRMDEARQRGLAERIELYRKQRICKQIEWYSKGSRSNSAASVQWSIVSIAGLAAALILGILAAVNDWQLDFVGLFSAGSAAGVAWAAVKQFDVIARSYAQATADLNMIDARIRSTRWDEERQWAEFVNEAEEAISREHTAWVASRAS
jgi:ABC-type multidrug transport system fused ATPase/permease subunit